ncbi:MAG: hypothetical protein NTW21_33115 [Verrucomicrobia bacterium]|nr:hypothetical protein [Verrucomicrobiota bacterium]
MKTTPLLLPLALIALPVFGQSVQKFNDAVSSGGGRSSAVIGAETFIITSSVGELVTAPTAVASLVVESGFIATLAAELPVDLADDSGIHDGVTDAWENRYGITAFVPTNDLDRDGLNDLLEAAFNLDPGTPDAAQAYRESLFSQAGQQYPQLVFRRHKWHPGITLVPNRSTGLAPLDWTEAGITQVSVTEIDAETDEVTVRSTTPVSAETQQFMRLKATHTPPVP